jgi:hypothetical protein
MASYKLERFLNPLLHIVGLNFNPTNFNRDSWKAEAYTESTVQDSDHGILFSFQEPVHLALIW